VYDRYIHNDHNKNICGDLENDAKIHMAPKPNVDSWAAAFAFVVSLFDYLYTYTIFSICYPRMLSRLDGGEWLAPKYLWGSISRDY